MEWKPVAGYEGAYEVSDVGLVRRVGKQPKAGWLGTHGYYRVSLWANGKVKKHHVHRLVAIAFVPGDHSLTVNHKDGDKLNNLATNLEWMSIADNLKHARETGLNQPKVPSDCYEQIYALIDQGVTQKAIADMYGCSAPLINAIKKNR